MSSHARRRNPHPTCPSAAPRLRTLAARTSLLSAGTLLLLSTLLLGACGQKGPLYLPQPSEQPQPAAPSDSDE